MIRVVGDLLRPNLLDEPSTEDLELVAVAKGEADEANASNPDRFAGVVDVDGSSGGVDKDERDLEDEVPAPNGEDGLGEDDFDDAKMFCPLTEANGELVEA